MTPAGRKKTVKILGGIAGISRRRMQKATDFPLMVMADMVLCQLQPKVEGNDRLGYRVKLVIPGNRSQFTVYIVKSGKHYRLRALADADSEVGLEVLSLLKKGRVRHARKWLDWVRGTEDAPSDAQNGLAFRHFYTAGKNVPKKRLHLAAALLAIANKAARSRMVKILERALRRRPSKSDRLQIERTLLSAYFAQRRYAKAAAITGRLLKLGGNKRSTYLMHLSTLLWARKFRKAARLARKWQRDQPTRWQSYFGLAEVAQYRGKLKESLKQLKRALSLSDAPPRVYNRSAWSALFVTPMPTKAAIQHALKGSRLSNYAYSYLMHTLATLYAETGELHLARKGLVKAMELRGRKTPDDADWYTYGRIAEHMGFRDVALRSYRKVEKPKRLSGIDTWILAQRRLKLLKAGRPGKGPKKNR